MDSAYAFGVIDQCPECLAQECPACVSTSTSCPPQKECPVCVSTSCPPQRICEECKVCEECKEPNDAWWMGIIAGIVLFCCIIVIIMGVMLSQKTQVGQRGGAIQQIAALLKKV